MANKYTLKMVVDNFVTYAKINIKDLATKQLTDVQKKRQLDNAVTTYLVTTLSGIKMGWITKIVIDKFVIKNIPVITQAIYDLLKAKVSGVTKG